MSRGNSLGERFARDENALTLVRLLLSLSVVMYHAHHACNEDDLDFFGGQLLSTFHVDAFFGLSGFLIYATWERCPDVWRYVRHRAARIFPGLWGALLTTALVIAPLAATFGDGPTPRFTQQLTYVAANMFAAHVVPTVGQVSNEALWSLLFEVTFYCVLVVAATRGVLTPRALWTAFVIFWAFSLGWAMVGGSTVHAPAVIFHRPGLMLVVGMLFWVYRDRIPMNWLGATASLALLTAGCLTPDYRLVGAVGLVYLGLYAGFVLGKVTRLRVNIDLSYGVYLYHFPLQTTLVVAGLGGLGWWTFTAASLALALPVAVMSWFVIERPALRWARSRDVDRSRRPRGGHGMVQSPGSGGEHEGATDGASPRTTPTTGA